MRTVWHVGPDGPVCSWCPSGEESENDLGLIDEEEVLPGSFTPANFDYAAHSLLGSGEWFAPWEMRWSQPSRW